MGGRDVRHDQWFGGVAIALILACTFWAGAVTLAPDGMIVVDGQRRFVLGLYENPADDSVLDAVAEAGFNLVRATGDEAALDRLQGRGLYAWVNTGQGIDLSKDRPAREAQLAALAATCSGHPALLVWEVPDEALWNCWYSAFLWRRQDEPAQLRERIDALEDTTRAASLGAALKTSERLFGRGDFAEAEEVADGLWRELGEDLPRPGLNISNAPSRAAQLCAGMVEGYAVLRKLDPRHPIWMNHAPRNQIAQLAAFNEGADIVGCDIYPAPQYRGGHSDLGDRSLASVGAFTTRMQAAAPGKPVWMVLQGFGWADLEKDPDADARLRGRRPNATESRFMAYDAIVRGARGVLYWGTHCVEKDSALWTDLLEVVRELADLEPVLAAPDAGIDPEVTLEEAKGSLDRGVRVLGKDVDGAIWWLVVNEFQDPLTYTLSGRPRTDALGGLAALEGTVYTDPEADRRATVTDGRLRLAIRGYGVQVLRPVDAAF